MNTSSRIKKIIEHLNLNNNSFSKKLGISSTTIDGYTKGRKDSSGNNIISKPNFDVIRKMVQVFNINAEYVLGFSDKMFNSDKKTSVNNNNLSNEVKKIITNSFILYPDEVSEIQVIKDWEERIILRTENKIMREVSKLNKS